MRKKQAEDKLLERKYAISQYPLEAIESYRK